MAQTKERVRAAVRECAQEAERLMSDITYPVTDRYVRRYQAWYTQSISLVRALAPDRIDEFVALCMDRRAPNEDITAATYDISDYLRGIQVKRNGDQAFDVKMSVLSRLNQQMAILESVETRLEDIYGNLKGLAQAGLLDGELRGARELLAAGHTRAAAVVAGVVLEAHLAAMHEAHGMEMPKARPTLNDWNEALKAAGVIDVAEWRRNQYFGAIRNKAAHPSGPEPVEADVQAMIDGVGSFVKAD